MFSITVLGVFGFGLFFVLLWFLFCFVFVILFCFVFNCESWLHAHTLAWKINLTIINCSRGLRLGIYFSGGEPTKV